MLAAERVPLNWANVSRSDRGLTRAGSKHFGSWANAIKAAGLDYGRIRRKGFWSRVLIVERIRALKEAGKPLNFGYVSLHHATLMVAAYQYIGSWRKAIEAAGLDYAAIRKTKRWSQRSVVSEIRRMKREGVDVSITTEVVTKCPGLRDAAIRHFGTWRAAMRAAGLEKLYRRYCPRS